jgi:hypothetical protein
VIPVNTAPRLAFIPGSTNNPNALLTFTASATDTDTPPQTLTFSLDPGAPAGASIGPVSGAFAWLVPSGALGEYPITVRVTDNGTPPLSAAQTFTVTVVANNNTAPVLQPIGSKFIYVGETLTFTATALDADQPPQTLTFSLLGNTPGGATINPGTGLFSWTPGSGQAPSTNSATILVQDNGLPPLSDQKTVTIVVAAPAKAGSVVVVNSSSLQFSMATLPGRRYQLAYQTQLEDSGWTPVGPVVTATDYQTAFTADRGSDPQRFYRVQVLP